jgi:cell division protein FtsB
MTTQAAERLDLIASKAYLAQKLAHVRFEIETRQREINTLSDERKILERTIQTLIFTQEKTKDESADD